MHSKCCAHQLYDGKERVLHGCQYAAEVPCEIRSSEEDCHSQFAAATDEFLSDVLEFPKKVLPICHRLYWRNTTQTRPASPKKHFSRNCCISTAAERLLPFPSEEENGRCTRSGQRRLSTTDSSGSSEEEPSRSEADNKWI